MGCDAETACGDCTTECNDRSLVDMEDYETELAKLRARTKELEETMAKVRLQQNGTNGHTNGNNKEPEPAKPKLRSSDWFNRKSDLGMSSLYVERYLNMGFTREELMSDKPIIGIVQSGSDIAPVSAI